MVIPQGVNIPMPRPFGGIPPAISKTPLGEDAAGGELITISLVGEIGPITQYLEVFDVLDTATEKDQVRIVLDTPGGDVYTTQQIVGRMESCKAKVTTVASGLVASAGTFIWLYGHEQEIERWARFMFHSSLHGDWGKSLTIKENATELVKFMASILSDAEKRGILLAAEVQQILKGKADLELSAGTVKARKRRRWVDEEGATGEEGDDSVVEPAEGEEGDEGGEEPTETPEAKAKKLTKKKVIKKTKKRIASAEGDEGDGSGEVEPGEGDDGAGEGEGGESNPEETTIEDIFSDICEENGIENPDPVEPAEGETDEGDDDGEGDGAPAAKKCGGKKKAKKRRCAEGGCESGEGEGDDDPDAGEGGEGDAPTAKKCGKKKAKKRRCAEGEEEVCPDCGKPCSECECGDDDDDDDGCEGDDCDDDDSDDTPDETTVEDIFDSICEENGVEVPAEEPGEGDDDGECDGECDDDTGDGAPSAKCSKGGKKKKAKKPMKKRRSEGGENITTGTDNDADKNSHLRKVPSNRFW